MLMTELMTPPDRSVDDDVLLDRHVKILGPGGDSFEVASISDLAPKDGVWHGDEAPRARRAGSGSQTHSTPRNPAPQVLVSRSRLSEGGAWGSDTAQRDISVPQALGGGSLGH
jgi:hypothetical protein